MSQVLELWFEYRGELFLASAMLCLYLLYSLTLWRWIHGFSTETVIRILRKSIPIGLLLAATSVLFARYFGWDSRAFYIILALLVLLFFRPMASQMFGLMLLLLGGVLVVLNVAVFWYGSGCSLLEYLSFSDCQHPRYTKLALGYGLSVVGLLSLVGGLVRGPEQQPIGLRPHTAMRDPSHERTISRKNG